MTRLAGVGFVIFAGLTSLPSHAFIAPDGNNYHAGIIQVSAGGTHTCALMADFHVSCWGTSPVALGLTPLPVPGLDRAIKVVSGNNFACALLIDHTVSCWGDNSFGQLGDGTHTSRPNNPAPVMLGHNAFDDVEDISVGAAHVCAIKSTDAEAGLTHTVWCWGLNTSGQLGNYTVPHVDFRQPIRVVIRDDMHGDAFLSGVESVAAGTGHTCVLIAGGHTIACWGANNYRQVGNVEATTDVVDSPVGVKIYDDKGNLVDFASAGGLSAGAFHSCILEKSYVPDFAVACWGSDDHGQIGNPVGTTALPATVVVRVDYPPTDPHYEAVGQFVSLGLGGQSSCGQKAGSIWCWGDNSFGQVGNNADCSASCESPVLVSGSTLWAISLGISTGAQHACAWTNHITFCWGRNDSGQLGTGSPSDGPDYEPVAANVDAPIFTDNMDGN